MSIEWSNNNPSSSRKGLKSKVDEAATSSPECRVALIRTVEAISNYVKAFGNSVDIDEATGEVIGEGLPQYSEGFTREGFIDPILLALGWDVSRKRKVGIEKRIDYDRVADYILRHSTGEAFAVVEAKKLNEELEKHQPQLFAYMHAASADVGILTNGFSWNIYKRQDEKINMVFSASDVLKELTEDEASIFCDLVGFEKNYRSKQSRKPRVKPPSPLEDGWVET